MSLLQQSQAKRAKIGVIAQARPPTATADWSLVDNDKTRTVIPTHKYFKSIGVYVGETAAATVDNPRAKDPHNIEINLGTEESIKMMALFILDILHDNSGARGGGTIITYFSAISAQTAISGTHTGFQMMVYYILYGIWKTDDVTLGPFVNAIVAKCYELAGGQTPLSFPPNKEKEILKKIMDETTANVHNVRSGDVAPLLKPLELMLDQGTAVVMSVLGSFPSLNISIINKMDMGDILRTTNNVGAAIVAITNPEAGAARTGTIQEAIQKSKKYVTEYYSYSYPLRRFGGGPATKRKAAATTPYVGVSRVNRRPVPIDTTNPIINEIVKRCLLVFDANLDKGGAFTYRPSIEHAYILFIEEEFTRALEEAITLNENVAPNTKNGFLELLTKTTDANTAVLLKEYLRIEDSATSENTLNNLIIKGFVDFKKDEIDSALDYNYIVHSRPANITINITLGATRINFFTAKYSVDEDECAIMNLNGRRFRSTFSAAEAGKWVTMNVNRPGAMKNDFTLACLAKYVGDLNQFIFGFYMGIVVASEDTSAIANAAFLMNYISSDSNRLAEFKGQRNAITLAQQTEYKERLKRGMMIATSVRRGQGLGVRYLATDAALDYIKIPEKKPGMLKFQLVESMRFSARQQTNIETHKAYLIKELRTWAEIVGADAFTPKIRKWIETKEEEAVRKQDELNAVLTLTLLAKQKAGVDELKKAITDLTLRIDACVAQKEAANVPPGGGQEPFKQCYQRITSNILSQRAPGHSRKTSTPRAAEAP